MKKLCVLLMLLTLVLMTPSCKNVEAQAVTVDLKWTAPYEDFSNPYSGAVTSYALRYSVDSTLLVNSFEGASGGILSIIPKTPGEEELHTLSLTANSTYFVAIKSVDEAGNVSAISNIVRVQTKDTTPPSAITDLREVE